MQTRKNTLCSAQGLWSQTTLRTMTVCFFSWSWGMLGLSRRGIAALSEGALHQSSSTGAAGHKSFQWCGTCNMPTVWWSCRAQQLSMAKLAARRRRLGGGGLGEAAWGRVKRYRLGRYAGAWPLDEHRADVFDSDEFRAGAWMSTGLACQA